MTGLSFIQMSLSYHGSFEVLYVPRALIRAKIGTPDDPDGVVTLVDAVSVAIHRQYKFIDYSETALIRIP